MTKRLLTHGFLLLSVVLAVVIIAYPNPLLFFRTMVRFVWLPIDPKAVADTSTMLPNDPYLIESWVSTHIMHDSDGYEAWGVFAYIATPTETLARERGPCRARSILLASIFEAKGIPYRLYTNVHAWVDYHGRISTSKWEQPQYALMYWEKGGWHFNGFGWLAIAPEQLAYFIKDTWQSFSPVGRIALMLIVSAVGGYFCYGFWHNHQHRKYKDEGMESKSVVIFATLAILVAAALVAHYGFTIVDSKTIEPYGVYDPANPAKYVDKIWTSRLPVAIENAVELPIILYEMKPDTNGMASKDSLIPIANQYGIITVWDAHVYMVKGSGSIINVNTETRLGTAEVALDGYSGPIKTLIYIGTRIPSDNTSVRDALRVDFLDIKDATGFGVTGREINERILSEVIDDLNKDNLINKAISFTGAFTIRTFNFTKIEVNEIYIVPVEVEVIEYSP